MASLWRRKNSKYWTACFTAEDGRQLKCSTKETNRQKAQVIADGYESVARKKATAIQTRKVIADLHRRLTGEDLPTVTVRSHLNSWLEGKLPTVGRATGLLYSRSARIFLERIGAKADGDIGDVRRVDIERFRNAEGKRVSPSTANNLLKCVRWMFRDAVRDGLIAEDPSEFVGPLRSEHRDSESKRRPFTLDEVKRVLGVANEEWQSLIYFGLYTGQRLGDIANLTWRNVDLDAGEISLTTAKTGRVQSMPISLILQVFLIGQRPENAKTDDPIHPEAFRIVKEQSGRTGTLSRQFGDLLCQAGLREKRARAHWKSKDRDEEGRDSRRKINPLTFHSLRHTATSLLHDAGVPSAVSQSIIGHDSKDVHEIYISVGQDAIRDAVSKIPDIAG